MKIPTYQMQGSTTTESASARISPDSYGQTGRNMELLGSTINNATLKIQNAYDEQSALKAQTEMSKGISALKLKMSTDTKLYENKPTYMKEFATLKENSLKMVGNPRYRENLNSKFDMEGENFKFDYNSAMRPQQIQNTLAEGDNKRNANSAEFINANPVRQNILLQELRDSYIHEVQQGARHSNEAIKEYEKNSRAWIKGDIDQKIQFDAEGTLKALRAGYFDVRENAKGEKEQWLNPLDKADLMEKASMTIKNNAERIYYIKESEQANNEVEIIKGISKRELNQDSSALMSTIETANEDGAISQKLFNSIERATKNPVVMAGTLKRTTDNAPVLDAAIVDIAKKMKDPTYPKENLRSDIVDYWSKGEMLEADMNRFVDSSLSLNNIGATTVGPKQNTMLQVISEVEQWAYNHAKNINGSFANIFRKTFDQVKEKGVDFASEIVKKVIHEEAIAQNPELVGQDKYNNVMDKDGGFNSVMKFEAESKSTRKPDLVIGNSIIISKGGKKLRIPASRRADAEKLQWIVEEKPEEDAKSTPSKK